ncbi:MAG: hypothetical protein Q7S76_02185, partial [bacterium]|nr:hypothetical protein [bacterium]
MSKKKNVSEFLLEASEGLISTATDLMLFQLFLPYTLLGKHSPSQIHRGFDDAEKLLEEINYRSIKRTLYHL